MRYILKFLATAICGVFIAVVVIRLVDPSRFETVLGDWGRKYGYYEFAIERYSRALHLNASNATAFNSRGVTRYYMEQYNYAVEDYNRAIALDPQFALAFKNRALAMLALGRDDFAKKDYEIACGLGRCEDFNRKCSELKTRCESDECTSYQTAIKANLCPGESK